MAFKAKSVRTRHRFARRLARLALVIFLFTCSPWVGRTARAQYSYPSAKNPVLDIFFIDSLQGWILEGENNSAVLSHTVDGGNSWSRFGRQPPIYKLFFLNSVHGWALTVDWPQPDAPATTLHETWDGGHTWRRLATIVSSEPNRPSMIEDFWFLDSKHGWFVGHGSAGAGIALQTSDGGKSIQEVRSISGGEALRHISGQDASKLWIFGPNSILASFDGGATWQSQLDVETMLGDRKNVSLASGFVLVNGTGWAVGGGGGATILATTDSGTTWHVVLDSEDKNFLKSVSFADSVHGCAVGASTWLFCTSDGGKNWTTRRVLPKASDSVAIAAGISVDNSFTKILYTTPKRAWVLSEGGFLFQTDEGGSIWRQCHLDH
jgi:photosystem II stability/assembly factor-like uncharacterized protein